MGNDVLIALMSERRAAARRGWTAVAYDLLSLWVSVSLILTQCDGRQGHEYMHTQRVHTDLMQVSMWFHLPT